MQSGVADNSCQEFPDRGLSAAFAGRNPDSKLAKHCDQHSLHWRSSSFELFKYKDCQRSRFPLHKRGACTRASMRHVRPP